MTRHAEPLSAVLPRVLRDVGLPALAAAVESGRPLAPRERYVVDVARVVAAVERQGQHAMQAADASR